MKVLFIGGVFSREMEEEILSKSKGVVQYAANKLQWNLIDGFLNIEEIDLEILTAPFVGAYPREFKDSFIRGKKNKYKNLVRYNSVSFCNVWGIRNISRKNSLKKQMREFVSEKGSKKIIFVYSPHTPFLEAAVLAKQKDPSIHICLIVPDLPQYMNLNEKKSIVYSKLKEIDIRIFTQKARFIDSFVLLTEQMKDVLDVGKRPYVVVEGMVNIDEIVSRENEKKENSIKTVVYTGTLNKKFGVVNLVKAFHAINDPDVILQICGRGDSENIIKEYASRDRRIQFLGQLSNDEAVNLQKNATILVNPRQNNEEFTKYSFPSKNMEYLLSGNPVIAYKLDGIPKEYEDHFYFVGNNSIESLSGKINEVLNFPDKERREFGKRAKDFVIKKKNNLEVTSKIFNMIKNDLN